MASNSFVPRTSISAATERRCAQQLAALQFAERRWAYALLRLLLGVDLFSRALLAVLYLAPASIHTVAISSLELLLGALLILGLLPRTALIASTLLTAALLTVTTLRHIWPAAGHHLLLLVALSILLLLLDPYSAGWPTLFGIHDRRLAKQDRRR